MSLLALSRADIHRAKMRQVAPGHAEACQDTAVGQSRVAWGKSWEKVEGTSGIMVEARMQPNSYWFRRWHSVSYFVLRPFRDVCDAPRHGSRK